MVSKKSDSSRVKTSSTTVIAPVRPKAPNRLKSPSSPKSGAATTSSGSFGAVRPQLSTSATASTALATAVMAAMPMSRAPLTPRASRATVSSTPRQKTRAGQPVSAPLPPSCTGTVVCAASGTRVTKPASTKPMNAMNRPMPTPIACFSGCGIARMTASRSPVTTRTQISRPSSTIRPIASSQLISGAIWKATTALMPRPAASASGRLPPTPMATVVTAATRAVAVTSWTLSSRCPNLSSALPRTRGFRTRM